MVAVFSFVLWFCVVTVLCVGAWYAARRRYMGGLNTRLLRRLRKAATQRFVVYFVPERNYGSVSGPSYKVYERGRWWGSWDSHEDAVKYCKALRYEYIQEKLKVLHNKHYSRKWVF